MRLWDIRPGYLNRKSLLGEHRERYGFVSLLVHCGKTMPGSLKCRAGRLWTGTAYASSAIAVREGTTWLSG